MHVADEFRTAVDAGDPIDSDVENDSTRFDPRSSHELGAPDGGNENIGLLADGRQVFRAGMGDRHRRVGGQQKHRHRSPDNRTSSNDHRTFAARVDATQSKKMHAAERCARHEDLAQRLPAEEAPGVLRVEPVDVFPRGNGRQDTCTLHMSRERELDQDPIDGVVGGKSLHQLKNFRFGGGCRKSVNGSSDAGFLGGALFVADVNRACRVVTNEDDMERRHAPGKSLANLCGYARADRCSKPLPVQDRRAHVCCIFRWRMRAAWIATPKAARPRPISWEVESPRAPPRSSRRKISQINRTSAYPISDPTKTCPS